MGSFDDLAFIVLAAGLGTRMKSEKAKVLHELNGKYMIFYIMETLNNIVGNNIIVVVGYQANVVKNTISKKYSATFAFQDIPKGTGHAVSKAIPFIEKKIKNIVVLCGDVPLVQADTLKQLVRHHIAEKNDVTIQAVNMENPKGYGRILLDPNNRVKKIIEESDANEEEKKIKMINTGIYCVEKSFLIDSINKIEPKNVKNEYYLTDIIGIGYQQNKKIGAIVGKKQEEFIGINSLEDLKKTEEMLIKSVNKIP